MRMIGIVLWVVLDLALASAQSPSALQTVQPLWLGGAPGAAGNQQEDRPTLTIYLPEAAKTAGTGVVICPGGAYVGLSMDHEGIQVARWLNSHGVAAFVLKYRLAPRYRHPAMLEDAQRALRLVRFNARDFGIARDRIGIWGFSAGGHLASAAGTHFDSGDPNARDPIDRMSSRPDFLILAYPGISFTTSYTDVETMKNLVGEHGDPKVMENLSNELQVTIQTPPTFLFHTNEDDNVLPENSVLFYLALRKAGVPAELHIYEHGQHGSGLAAKDPILATWTILLADWLKGRGLLGK